MYFIGLDLGQRRDFSAIAVIERQDQMAAWSPTQPVPSSSVTSNEWSQACPTQKSLSGSAKSCKTPPW